MKTTVRRIGSGIADAIGRVHGPVAEALMRVSLRLLLVNCLHIVAIVLVWKASTTGQAQDAAAALREGSWGQLPLRLFLPIAMAALLVALSSRLSGTVSTRHVPDLSGANLRRVGQVVASQVVPATLACGTVAIALLWLAPPRSWIAEHFFLLQLGIGALAITALLMLRRPWMHDRESSPPAGTADVTGGAFRNGSKAALAIGVLVVVGLVALCDPAAARHIGPLGALVIGVHAWAAALTLGLIVVPQFIERRSLKVAWIGVLLLPAAFSSDIHRLSTCPEIPGEAVAKMIYSRPEAALYSWLEPRIANAGANEPIPVVLVSADGGGIRAAYWTARSLAVLNVQLGGRLAENIFAYSGVSGGSLGLATFVDAAVNRRLSPEATLRAIDEFYSRDLLTPSLARLMSVEPLRYYLSLQRVEGRDRLFERVIEQDWRRVSGSSSFGNSFVQVMGLSDARELPPPLLILNATVAETGKRIEISNIVDIDPGPGVSLQYFATRNPTTLPDLTLAQAVHLSARFPGISPPAALYARMCSAEAHKKSPEHCEQRLQHWFTIVDGGYNDNSGIAPIEEIIDVLARARRMGPDGGVSNVESDGKATLDRRARVLSRVSFHVIVIANSPNAVFDPYYWKGCPVPRASDLGTALSALEHSREQRAYDSHDDLQNSILRLRHELDAEDYFRQSLELKDTGKQPQLRRCVGGLGPMKVQNRKSAACTRIGDTVFLNSIQYNRRSEDRSCPTDPSRLEELPLGWVLSPTAREEIKRASEQLAESARSRHFDELDEYWTARQSGAATQTEP